MNTKNDKTEETEETCTHISGQFCITVEEKKTSLDFNFCSEHGKMTAKFIDKFIKGPTVPSLLLYKKDFGYPEVPFFVTIEKDLQNSFASLNRFIESKSSEYYKSKTINDTVRICT